MIFLAFTEATRNRFIFQIPCVNEYLKIWYMLIFAIIQFVAVVYIKGMNVLEVYGSSEKTRNSFFSELITLKLL